MEAAGIAVQFLESYKSVTLQSMATAFGVSVDFIDEELVDFIVAGRLPAKIDKVPLPSLHAVSAVERCFGMQDMQSWAWAATGSLCTAQMSVAEMNAPVRVIFLWCAGGRGY